MKLSRSVWISLAVLAVWLIFSWLLGSWMGLRAPQLYYLRGGLAIIGFIGFAGFLLLKPKNTPESEGPLPVSSGEVDDNFNEAFRQIQKTGAKNLARFPVVFFFGDNGSGKTTIIAKSDIAQTLAGQVERNGAIVPTRSVNFWLAKNTLFVDCAGAMMSDAAARKRLFRKFSPAALKSAVGGSAPPPRSVVYTVECQAFMGAGGAEAMAAKARQFQNVLNELSQEIGASFPVYVLFTKADKIQHFLDYVANLNETEVAEVLGVTLPFEKHHGAYAEEQGRRVGAAFQQVYYSLSDRRPLYLGRETRALALPNIYEFPRQFGKLRTLTVSFLVDLCRPSQLGASPYLRGFYFSGTRTLLVNDVAPAAARVAAPDESVTDATRIFDPRAKSAPLVQDYGDLAARKVEQWVYLSRFLPEVILADASANQLGSANFKVNLARRVLLGAAAAAALVMAIWWTVSYSHNHALVDGVLEAAKGVPDVNYAAGQYPSIDTLQRLTKIKDTLVTLNEFHKSGAPLSYGGFLYSGEAARDSVQRTYFGLFRRILLAPTQQRLVAECTTPDESKGFPFSYEALKSYLITTEYPNYSTSEFLTPALLRHWKADQNIDDVREKLVSENLDFYARELPSGNPYLPTHKADTTAKDNCRAYLNKFGQTGRIYNAMLSDARAGGKTFYFNSEYPETGSIERNMFPVPPEFLKAGYAAFQQILKDPKKYFTGEPWVLGSTNAESLDANGLTAKLRDMYNADSIKTWQAYLAATHLVPYNGLSDAIGKLDKLSSGRSPLLLALCVASENTAAQSKEISDAFQSVQTITPAGCLQSGFQSADAYMKRLIDLMEALKALKPSDAPSYEAARNAANQIDSTVKQMATRFLGAPTSQSPGALTERILKEPIYNVSEPPPAGPPSEAACESLRTTLNKYPFNPDAAEEATLQEVNAFLKKPDGLLWKLVNDAETQKFVKQFGDNFTAIQVGNHRPKPEFLQFLNRSAQLSRALYPNDTATNPSLAFRMKPVALPDIEHVTLVINGQTLTEDLSGSPYAKDFTWPGTATGADLRIKIVGGSTVNLTQVQGLWAPWRLLDRSEPVSGSSTEFDWVTRQAGHEVKTNNGNPEKARFSLDADSARILRPQYFKLTCVSKAIR